MEVEIDDCQRKNNEFFGKLSKLAFSMSKDLYIKSLVSEIERKGCSYINESGGIYAGDSIDAELIEEFEFIKNEAVNNLFLNDDSKFLILENDPELDPWTKENIKEPYSYLLNLRTCMKNETFLKYLKMYMYNGKYFDRVILIYTTGSDMEQMENYLTIISNNFKGIVIEFIFATQEFKEEHLKILKKYDKLKITHNY